MEKSITEINDIRQPTQFKGFSFSNYKNSEVKKTLKDNMLKGKIEPACYWCAELICAGHFVDAWECIINYVGKHIHLGNPKLIIYLEMRYEIFRDIMSKGNFITELQLRNNIKIRKLFAEIISMITLSNKKHSFEAIKINRQEEYDITQMTERLKAPSTKYVDNVFKKKDPKELLIAVNEFTYSISPDRRNMTTACYWYEWIIEFDNICKKRKEPCYCVRRDYPVENKFQCDIVWILWDAIQYYSEELKNPYISKLLKAVITMFCIKYTTAACKKRRYLFYFAVALLTEPVPTNIELVTDKTTVSAVIDNIDQIYKQIKKNEVRPNTEYLFSNLEKENTFEKSMRKLEMMDSLANISDED
jgi:hypothetical protein